LDYGILRGDGSGEPEGMLNCTAAGINSVAVGGALSYDKIMDAMGTLWDDNEEPNVLIISPQNRKELFQRKDGNGDYLKIPPPVDQLRILVTTQMPNTSAIVADLRQVYLFLRSQIKIEFSRQTSDAMAKGLVEFRGMLRADAGVSRPQAVCKMTGIV
jgi:HK97 family phage major capsid protein